MIDPDFWTDEALGTLPVVGRLLFMGLISNADDEGRLRGNPALLKSTIFPYDEDLTAADLDDQLDALAERRLIQRYTVDAQAYIHAVNFKKHQTINRPSPSKLPPPPEDSGTATVPLSEDSVSEHEQVTPKLREVKLSEVKLSKENEDGGAFETNTPATTDDAGLSEIEREVAGYVQAVRGMASVPAVEIIAHIREGLSDCSTPIAASVMRVEFRKFRDLHGEKRKNQPHNKRWRGWKNAVTNWLAKIPDAESPPAGMHYPDVTDQPIPWHEPTPREVMEERRAILNAND